VPRGYPRQEVPVGSGDVSGMYLTTDIHTRAYQPMNSTVLFKNAHIPRANWSGYAMGLRSKIRYLRFNRARPWEFGFDVAAFGTVLPVEVRRSLQTF
jgi:hypothetical protein